jgi:hypothetical protein
MVRGDWSLALEELFEHVVNHQDGIAIVSASRDAQPPSGLKFRYTDRVGRKDRERLQWMDGLRFFELTQSISQRLEDQLFASYDAHVLLERAVLVYPIFQRLDHAALLIFESSLPSSRQVELRQQILARLMSTSEKSP